MSDDTTYNGWANYETWNISLWVMNDEALYREMISTQRQRDFDADSAKEFASMMFGDKTPDGVSINDSTIDWDSIAEGWNA